MAWFRLDHLALIGGWRNLLAFTASNAEQGDQARNDRNCYESAYGDASYGSA